MSEPARSDQAEDGAVVHFIQAFDGPVFQGVGQGVLECAACGNRLIDAYDPAYFIDIGLQCGRCAAVTTTLRLADPARPPFAVIIAEPVAESRRFTATLNPSAFIISRAEIDRVAALFQPRTPDWRYQITATLLEEAVATHRRITGRDLPSIPADPARGLPQHALAWAIAHLQARVAAGPWRADDGIPTPIAVVTVAGFLHFVGAWSHHPGFPAMVAGAASRGFSSHGLAPFVAAYCAAMMGNRVSFPARTEAPAAATGFDLAVGPTEKVPMVLDVFDRFEVPFGQPWTPAALRTAVAERVAATAGRINPRHHGLLLLSPGPALLGFDEALIAAIQDVVQGQGRRHRGLMAVAPVVLRLQQMPEPDTVRLCYGFFPVPNRHYEGDTALQAAR
ncbi:hypothetical protein [Rhodopila sp.]|uniref:hypothetical protein n=1 Tax=Rhodopila sp. TaxID=2480087 RepID=UPI002B5DD8F7|nr:hypothetical protein [Rhodopila sp.]HVZ08134.1 hypothetical protein [Rhodopila sp.]